LAVRPARDSHLADYAEDAADQPRYGLPLGLYQPAQTSAADPAPYPLRDGRMHPLPVLPMLAE
jgi:hypothetical protein